MSDSTQAKARGFKPSELLLGYHDWSALLGDRRDRLPPDERCWLAVWELRDLNLSPRDDLLRRADRRGHHAGWFEAIDRALSPNADAGAVTREEVTPFRVTHARWSLTEAAENLVEYVDILLFALTDHDKPHQDHAREMVEGWAKELRLSLADAAKKGGQ